jgi:Putative transposase of IS4/5 family (DUF4096)
MKSGSRRVFRYSSTHEKVLPDGFIRYPMEHHRASFARPTGHGRLRTHTLREIVNAVFYLLKSGCQWRLLPHDFPRWPTVYHYFRKWRLEMVPGSGSTGPSVNGCGFAWAGIHRAQRGHIVDSQGSSRAPRYAGKRGVTIVARRSKDESVTSFGRHRGFRTLKAKIMSAKA